MAELVRDVDSLGVNHENELDHLHALQMQRQEVHAAATALELELEAAADSDDGFADFDGMF